MYLKGGLHPREEMAMLNVRKELEDDEEIYERSEIEFNSNDQLGISRVDINFDEVDDDEDDDDNNK